LIWKAQLAIAWRISFDLYCRQKMGFRGNDKVAAFHTHKFQKWDQFKRELWQKLPGGHDFDIYKRFIFRGQADARWKLTSTLDRTYLDKRPAKKDAIATELIKEFYEECARFSDWRYKVDDPRVLAMAQHHGMPTRLLDWSYSPYVAAYFA